jgi:hypothetical protein
MKMGKDLLHMMQACRLLKKRRVSLESSLFTRKDAYRFPHDIMSLASVVGHFTAAVYEYRQSQFIG